jgi:hypothetical protein
MAGSIRENPIHAAPIPAVKAATPRSFGAAPVSMATRVGGGLHSYLGHFAQPKNLAAGHNNGAGRSPIKERAARKGTKAGASANASKRFK